jgi:hypothetical protein
MSWSVSSFGKPAAVKAALTKQFESAKNATKNIPHEQATVIAVETIVNGELDFLAARTNAPVVKVMAGGSAYFSADGTGSSQMTCSVNPEYGFVE